MQVNEPVTQNDGQDREQEKVGRHRRCRTSYCEHMSVCDLLVKKHRHRHVTERQQSGQMN